ncbi:hypothetical protein AHAS_Ahas09G0026400 [Arachis hypogaea]
MIFLTIIIIIIIITVTHFGSMILLLTISILTSQFVKNSKLASTPIIKIQTFWSKKYQIVIGIHLYHHHIKLLHIQFL